MTLDETKSFIVDKCESARVFNEYMLTPGQLDAVIEMAFAAGEVNHAQQTVRNIDSAVLAAGAA